MYIYIYIYVYIYIYTHVYILPYTHVRTHSRTHTHKLNPRTHTHTHAHTLTQTHHTYIQTHTHTYSHAIKNLDTAVLTADNGASFEYKVTQWGVLVPEKLVFWIPPRKVNPWFLPPFDPLFPHPFLSLLPPFLPLLLGESDILGVRQRETWETKRGGRRRKKEGEEGGKKNQDIWQADINAAHMSDHISETCQMKAAKHVWWKQRNMSDESSETCLMKAAKHVWSHQRNMSVVVSRHGCGCPDHQNDVILMSRILLIVQARSHTNIHMCMCEIPCRCKGTIPYRCEGNRMRACRAPFVRVTCLTYTDLRVTCLTYTDLRYETALPSGMILLKDTWYCWRHACIWMIQLET